MSISKKKVLKVFTISGIILGLVIFFIAGIHYLSKNLCGDDEFQTFTSPNGQHKAELYQRNCGATTDFSGHVRLDGKEIFNLYHYHDNITVEWINDQHLFVQYAYQESLDDVTIRKTEYKGIKLEYFYYPCIGPASKFPPGQCLE